VLIQEGVIPKTAYGARTWQPHTQSGDSQNRRRAIRIGQPAWLGQPGLSGSLATWGGSICLMVALVCLSSVVCPTLAITWPRRGWAATAQGHQ